MKVHITEGIEGQWNYHLSEEGTNAVALCGKKTMYTSIPLEQYEKLEGGHLHQTYCKKCLDIYRNREE